MPLKHAIQSVDQDTSLLSPSIWHCKNDVLKLILREMYYQLEVPPELKKTRLSSGKKTADGAKVARKLQMTGGAYLYYHLVFT